MSAFTGRFLCGAATALAAIAASAPTSVGPQERLTLTFGVYQTDKATVMYRKFTPILEALQEDLQRRLEREVDVHLSIFRSYDEGLDALVRGEVDFVRFGPASYVMAKERNPRVHLLAMEQKKGKTIFSGLIVARRDSGIAKLGDLKGRTFAFGDENSTIGRFLAQAELAGAGIRSHDLADYRYLGRHDKVARAVEIGDFDAGSLKESTFKKLNKRGRMRVVHRFDNVTKPWIASAGLDPQVRAVLAASLLECEDEEVLGGFGVTAFVPARDEAYDMVREGMKRANDFEPTRPETPPTPPPTERDGNE